MKVAPGIIELDLHGMTAYQAKICLNDQLNRAQGGTYRIRIIHGYQSGTKLRDMIRSTYKKHSKVRRIEVGLNQGQTDLVLKEY